MQKKMICYLIAFISKHIGQNSCCVTVQCQDSDATTIKWLKLQFYTKS